MIVLGYNGRMYVDSCLASVLDQDFDRPYEVVFVDNGSTDGTADVADRFDRVRVHRLDRNHGYCQGNNIGAGLARAPLLVFLNQDVVVHRAWLSQLCAALDVDSAIMAAAASLVHPWNREFAAKERVQPVGSAYIADLSRGCFVEYREVRGPAPVIDTLFLSGVSIILKRETVDEIGGYIFDPDMFLYGEDMDLALRIRTVGYRTVVATKAVVYHSHVLQDELSAKAFLKTVRIIRNRLLALWKSSTWPEFLVLAAITMAGSPFNSGEFGLPAFKKATYFFLLVLPTIVAGIGALAAMPKYAARRRFMLSRRRVPGGWLIRALFSDRSTLSATVPLSHRV